MKFFILFAFVCTSSMCGFAHETNEAFFTIVQKENTIEIQAEFPWTMRSALIEFNPLLSESKDKRDFEKTFEAYIKSNLILTSQNGEHLNFKEFKEIDNSGHSHQNNYLIIFNGEGFSKITNTIMFNVIDNQVNYHTLVIKGKKETFKTEISQEDYELAKVDTTNYWWVFLLLIPVYFLINHLFFTSKRLVV